MPFFEDFFPDCSDSDSSSSSSGSSDPDFFDFLLFEADDLPVVAGLELFDRDELPVAAGFDFFDPADGDAGVPGALGFSFPLVCAEPRGAGDRPFAAGGEETSGFDGDFDVLAFGRFAGDGARPR